MAPIRKGSQQKLNGSNHAKDESPFRRRMSAVQEEITQQSNSNCASLAFMVLLWFVFSVTQVNHRQVKPQNSMQRALNGALTGSATVAVPSFNSKALADAATTDNTMVTANNATGPSSLPPSSGAASGTNLLVSKALSSVSSREGILDWLGQHLVPQLWAEGPGGRGLLQEFNRAVGGVRVVSARLGGGACRGSAALLRVYNLSCYGGATEGPGGSAPTAAPEALDAATESAGLQALWLDLAQDHVIAQAQIQQLRDGNWLTPGTQSIRVQSIFLNAHISLLAFAEVHFKLNRVGRITAFASVSTLPTEAYAGHWSVWCGDFVLLLLLLGFGAREVWLCLGCCKKCPRTPWWPVQVLNWVVILYGLGFSAFFGYLASRLQLLGECLGGIPRPPERAAALVSWDSAWSKRHGALGSVFAEVDRLSGLLRACEAHAFWYSLLLVLKFLEVCTGSPRLAVITAALHGCCVDLVHFLFVFAVVFANFALGAYLLFGHQLEEWSKVDLSLNTAFRALMGDFDFQRMWLIAPVSSITWFWLFMVLIVLVMLNMFLAIVLDAHAEVKERVRDRSTLWEEAASLSTEVAVLWRKPTNSWIEAFTADSSDEGEAEEGNAKKATHLPEELAEVKNLPSLIRQLEQTCWRYFWLEARSGGHATDSLVRVLTKSVPAPDGESPHAKVRTTESDPRPDHGQLP